MDKGTAVGATAMGAAAMGGTSAWPRAAHLRRARSAVGHDPRHGAAALPSGGLLTRTLRPFGCGRVCRHRDGRVRRHRRRGGGDGHAVGVGRVVWRIRFLDQVDEGVLCEPPERLGGGLLARASAESARVAG